MAELRHTWLFEPASWTAAGQVWLQGAIARDGGGTSIVRHLGDSWVVEGTMEILGDPPVSFQNDYRMSAPPVGAKVIPWESENPTVGVLKGVFVVADDTIMSSFQSADGGAMGSEHLTWVAPDRYQARGLFLVAGKVAAAWSMALVRQA